MKMDKSCLLALLLLLMVISPPCFSQSIPPIQDGFYYAAGDKPAGSAVVIEAYFDPTCPDSRDAWPPLKKLLQYYGPTKTTLVLHAFPLPYHDNAFAASQALHIVNNFNSSATFHLLEEFFKNQEQFYSEATTGIDRVAALDKIQNFVASVVGHKYVSAIKSGYNDTNTDMATRYGFKTGCIRGVYGTPFFFVNSFPLPNAGDALDYDGWRKVVDPLVKEQHKHQHKKKKFHFYDRVHLLK